MSKKERQKVSIRPTILDMKPPYSDKVAAKQFPPEYKVPNFQTFDGQKGNTKARIDLGLGAYSLQLQHEVLLRRSNYTLAELGRTMQYSGEDVDLYVKRFHEKTLDCIDPVDESAGQRVPP